MSDSHDHDVCVSGVRYMVVWVFVLYGCVGVLWVCGCVLYGCVCVCVCGCVIWGGGVSIGYVDLVYMYSYKPVQQCVAWTTFFVGLQKTNVLHLTDK